MKNQLKFLLPIFVILTIFSCGKKEKDTTNLSHESADHATEEAAIKNVLIDMWDAIEKSDIARYAAHIHPEFTQFGEYDPVLREGKEAEIKGIAEWIADSQDIHTEMINPNVTVNGDVAWITYYWKDEGETAGEAFASTGKSTRIFVKEDGKWLCIHGHYTLLTAE
ncbi:nuclear transport factor 2 family protein [Algoriphagus sp.]|uniref:YybH family protein n=1 Tax=Algoriphagus sp. TaxID=1872435 RepID=UPI0032969606